MKDSSIWRERLLALLIGISLVLLAPSTFAVVKNVTVVDGNGNALGNTKVTIVFPDGTEQEEETDDRGILIFDFPSDGDYKLVYPGGTMGVSVGGGIPTWAWVLGGAAVAGGVAVAANDSSSDDSGSPGTTGDPDPGTGSASDPCQGDTFNFIPDADFSTTVSSNPGGHPDEFGGPWEIFCNGTGQPIDISNVSSNNISVNFSCTVDTSGSCAASTDCMYAGVSTVCDITNSFSGTTWSGTLTAGGDGNLPGGQPITVSFTAPL